MDTFWAQDIINDWNDQYSPEKMPKPPAAPKFSTDDLSPKKKAMKEDRISKEAKKCFAQTKHAIADTFLKELDEKITQGKIAEMSASTGGVKVVWSKKLSTTAGRANWRRETLRPLSTEPATARHRHHASIELAEKIIDDEHRLLNVLAHEFCHLANFMVSGIKINPHGKEFKAWAANTGKVFGHRGIEVTTKHTYEIQYRFVWECANCGMEFGRHSKSVDTKRHRCGSCKGPLVQTRPVPKVNKDGTEKQLGEYQVFVKENMAKVKRECPGSPQKEVMAEVGRRYQEHKATKLVGCAEEGNGDGDGGLVSVVRKLEFMDLTSP